MKIQILAALSFWILLTALVLLLPTQASARRWQAGWMIGPEITWVDDPAGSTATKTHLSFLNGIVTIPYGRDQRLFMHLFYNDFDLNNRSNKVSGQIKSLGFNTAYQWKLRLSRHWKPWLGAGLGFSSDTFEDRTLLDGEGFILKDFPERQKEAVNLLINASVLLKRMRPFDLGLHLQYEVPLSGDIQRLIVAVTLLY